MRAYQVSQKQVISQRPPPKYIMPIKFLKLTSQSSVKIIKNQQMLFKKNKEIEKQNTVQMKKPQVSAYKHQYNSSHHPLNFSAVKIAESFHDFVGPEQVSPHYENFAMSRRMLLTFWGGYFLINFGMGSLDLNWIANSTYVPWVFWFQLMYFYVEGKKSLFMPLLNRFYRRAAANETYIMETFYAENIENKIRELLRTTKQQLQYWDIHTSYNQIKAESINNFLQNEYLRLQSHISNRALNILKTAQGLEQMNQAQLLQKLIDDALTSIDKALQGENREKVLNQMFDLAVEGLAKKQMNYDNDPLMPLILQGIEENVRKITSLTIEEQNNLISLTQEQLVNLKNGDIRARKEYLDQQPNLDNTLKQMDSVKKMLSSWSSQ
ncbi:hypothetical protein IMG5_067880 [Ichthyophthirius multifiliis]|uniref:Uncharacterized protein n=1 Tax=Ichthyophthirius multifiliis TaxID=5932 RepID=G0QPG9_ICHMU|nr:hypothetical protein IMG5_067880 [Ichthyophthirius multifiliis]EGR32882.1 hypothetical protein IMG5_067880 [Ichthyophthirius multifiliis]|eukprot:XP_004036868.1 hypothetical protein IMG5_067880 [Ichthyophthirius multifiliis]